MRSTLSELGAGLKRNKSMSISLIVTMTVSLMLASVGMLAKEQSDRTEKYFGDRLQVQVRLCGKNAMAPTCASGEATKEQKTEVHQALNENPNVKSIDVNTPEDNYEQAKETLGQTESGKKELDLLDKDSFGASYYVTMKDPEKSENVADQVRGMDGVDEADPLQEMIGPLFELLSKMRWASLSVALVLIVAAMLQVSNTIRMTAYARRREIGIMRLVGASSWHIQLPFILESLLAALISAALAASGVAAFMYFVVYRYLRVSLDKITTWIGWQEAFTVMGWTTVLAVVLALVPTFVVTKKYLDV